MKNESLVPVERIENVIYIVRGQKVMLDRDLATLYGVETGNLNKTVGRNRDRFPEDFMFRLSKNEFQNWFFQFGRSNSSVKMGLRHPPYAFTEQGVAMLSGLLRSSQAVSVNIEIMRAFVRLRKALASHEKLAKNMEELKSFVLKHSRQNDKEFRRVWQAIENLVNPLPPKNEPRIGFHLD